MIGTCVDVGAGCLKVQGLAACRSTLQTCAVGTTTCACPGSACTVGAKSCSSATTVSTCALDVSGGCGVFPAGGVTCGVHQSCTGAAPSSACACNVDPVCTAGNGSYCNAAATGTIACTTDSDACLSSAAAVLCPAPKTCGGLAPASSCSCPALAAQPITGGGCSVAAATSCETGGTNMLLTCALVGGCNVWQATVSCAATSLVCGNKSGAADCECAANATNTFYADAVNGSVGAALPYPTGLNSPAQCRFKTLTAALTLANAAAVTSPASVIATGSTGAGSQVFNGETFPLGINSNVTLTTSDTVPTPVNYVINFTDNTAARSAVVLHDLGALTGFTIQNVNGAATSVGISTSCPASPLGVGKVTGTVVIGKSTVVGNPSMAVGLNVVSNCSVTVDSTDLRSAGFGVRLIATTNATAVTMTNGTVDSNSAVGVLATQGTLTITGTTIKGSGLEGLRINPSAGAEVVFTQTGGIVESNVQGGLTFLAGGTAASTATVTNTEIRNNGSSSSSAATFFGILATAARTVNLVGVNVHNNAAGGLSAVGGAIGGAPTIVVTGASKFDFNGTQTVAGPGVNAAGVGTSFTATNATFNSNRGAGVRVAAQATGIFSAITVSGNGAGQAAAGNPGAFDVENGNATINTNNVASVIQRNVFNGIKVAPGTLTLTGTAAAVVDVSFNGLPSGTQPIAFSGAYLGFATVTSTYGHFHDNGAHGMEVFNTSPNPFGQPITLTSSRFANNTRSGLLVGASAPIVGTGANSLNVTSCSFFNNLHGVQITASAGDVRAAFQTNTITGASDTGMYVNSTANSALNFNGNFVTNNKAATLFGGQGVGGILFTGTPPSGGTLAFTSNQVHHNGLNQIIALGGNGVGPATWPLNGTAGVSCNAATANIFACYNSSPAASASVGVVGIGPNIIVQANGNSWQNAAPAFGTDFSTAGGAVFLPSPPSPVCTASTIACP